MHKKKERFIGSLDTRGETYAEKNGGKKKKNAVTPNRRPNVKAAEKTCSEP